MSLDPSLPDLISLYDAMSTEPSLGQKDILISASNTEPAGQDKLHHLWGPKQNEIWNPI